MAIFSTPIWILSIVFASQRNLINIKISLLLSSQNQIDYYLLLLQKFWWSLNNPGFFQRFNIMCVEHLRVENWSPIRLIECGFLIVQKDARSFIINMNEIQQFIIFTTILMHRDEQKQIGGILNTLTLAWNVIPWKKACSACNGMRRSWSSRTKSYGVDDILKKFDIADSVNLQYHEMNFILLSVLCETDDNSLNLIVDCLDSCLLALIKRNSIDFHFTPTDIFFFFFYFHRGGKQYAPNVYTIQINVRSIFVLFNLVFWVFPLL